MNEPVILVIMILVIILSILGIVALVMGYRWSLRRELEENDES